MKNHIKIDGKLLQTNKKWSHLKQRQRAWIYEITREEYSRFIMEQKRQPRKKSKHTVIDTVYSRITEKEIWIPFYEAERHIGNFIDKLNRKSITIVDDNGETITIKSSQKGKVNVEPKTPQIKYADLSAEEKEMLLGKIRTVIGLYINQAAKIPPNRIRDIHMKAMLSDFNRKQYNKIGSKVIKDEMMIADYDMIRKERYETYCRMGKLPVDTKKEKLKKSLTVLETDRLLIRKIDMSDWKEISAIISDIEVMYAWEKAFTTKQEAIDWIIKQRRRYKNEQVGYFLAIDKLRGNVVGQIGLMWNEINGENTLEVGYILKKEYWHNGYAVEGARACIAYGFNLFNIDKITATIRPENISSIAVAERLGMKLSGEYDRIYAGRLLRHLIYNISRENFATEN